MGNLSSQKVHDRLKYFDGQMKEFAANIEAATKYKVSILVLPHKDAESRLECVFPKNQEEMDLSVFSALNQLTEEKLLP